jgi:glycerol uptake facilitator-like aquaporin
MSALVAGTFLRTTLAQGTLVGITLIVLITLIGPLTGASFNPTRSLGLSIFSGYYDNQIVYYVGPVLGGLSAGLIFSKIPKSKGVRERRVIELSKAKNKPSLP